MIAAHHHHPLYTLGLLSLLKLNTPPAKAHFCGVFGKGGLSVGSLHLDGSCQRFRDVASDFPPLCMVLVAVELAALCMRHSPGTVRLWNH